MRMAVYTALLVSGLVAASAPTTHGDAAVSARVERVCSPAMQPGRMACMALRRVDPPLGGYSGNTGSAEPATPSGYGPADLQSAYDIPSGGDGVTVAITDAYDDPRAESDLAVYRSNFGLPACTTANGCFRKVNQSGQSSPLPAADSGWSGEISLDIDMVSAICPSCHILLVEASSNSRLRPVPGDQPGRRHGCEVRLQQLGRLRVPVADRDRHAISQPSRRRDHGQHRR